MVRKAAIAIMRPCCDVAHFLASTNQEQHREIYPMVFCGIYVLNANKWLPPAYQGRSHCRSIALPRKICYDSTTCSPVCCKKRYSGHSGPVLFVALLLLETLMYLRPLAKVG